MKSMLFVLVCICIFLSGCSVKNDAETKDLDTSAESSVIEVLKKGTPFSVKGVVGYSDEPSDIGTEYCYVTGNEKIEYYFTDIYNEQSKWASDVFYTQGDDTEILRSYVGQTVTVSGIFDAECHGVPYITNVTVKID